MSGASGSFGVTRYQWPRIIAAKTPPMAALTTASWTSSDDRAERAVAPGERPEHERRDGRGERRRPRATAGDPRPAPAERRARPRRATLNSAERRPPRRVPGRVDDDRRVGRATPAAPRRRARRGPRSRARTASVKREVAGGRGRSGGGAGRRPRTSPSARPVRTVQLTKARFWAICVAGTAPSVAAL